MAATLADLLAVQLPTETVTLPSGLVVTVRAMTRGAQLRMLAADDMAAKERIVLAGGMASPSMTEEEAGQWQDAASADDVMAASDAIIRLSMLTKEAAKSRVPETAPGQ